jgi:hypothetical protein
VASAAPLADQRHQASGGDGDAHAGGVGDTPARLLMLKAAGWLLSWALALLPRGVRKELVVRWQPRSRP